MAQPPVVAVVVAHNPGDWFADTLGSLAAQTYDNLSVVVVDAASTTLLDARVHAVLPDAVVHRLDANPGFGPACNAVVAGVEGAAFHLFCHDDVRLAPDAVALLVAEAFRANAGIVGPKQVLWDDNRRLLAVGMQADRLGQPVAIVERGELDQGQHDATSEVFFIPGGVTLVRADLFAAVGGFDPDIDFHGEDLDLCWRARVAGANVVVCPDAVVGHLEALGVRRPHDDRRRLQVAHRRRTLRVATTLPSRLWLMPLAFLSTIVEFLGAVVMWRPGHAADLVAAWWWNLRYRSSTRSRRKALAGIRAVSDAEVRTAQAGGLARLRALAAARRATVVDDPTAASADDATVGPGDAVAAATGGVPVGPRRGSFVAMLVVGALLVVGSRQLVWGRLPQIGDFVGFGDSASALLGQWWSGWQPVGLGAPGVVSPLVGLFGVVSGVLVGSTGAARTLLILGTLPLGALGVWRLATPLGSLRVRMVALIAALANPVTYDAVATGNWAALVLVATMPWILLHVARGARIEPFGRPRSATHHVVAAGLLTGLATMWLPAAPALVLAVIVVAALGGLLGGAASGTLRMVGVGIGAAIVAGVLNGPWLVGLISNGDTAVWLGAATDGTVPTGSALLRFATGPVGSSWLAFALPIAALPGLLFGRGWRLAWAARAWLVVVASWAALVVVGQGLVPDLPVAPAVLLAPVVSAVAVAVAAAAAAVRHDLSGYRMGWRQFAGAVAVLALAVSVLPALGSVATGRWNLPNRGFDDKLGFLDDERAEVPFRVLWITEPDRMPLAGWPVTAGPGDTLMSFGTTDNGLPRPAQLFTTPKPTGTSQLADAVTAALSGDTNRLGALVGPMAVRYVVVPERLAPGAPAAPTDDTTTQASDSPDTASIPTVGTTGGTTEGVALVNDALARQLDLVAAPVGGDVRVWENTAWVPTRALLEAPTITDPIPATSEAVLDGQGPGATGDLPVPGALYVAEQFAPGWSLTVVAAGDDTASEPPAARVTGWATGFAGTDAGAATLRFSPDWQDRAGTLAMPLLWLVALAIVWRRPARTPSFAATSAAAVASATGTPDTGTPDTDTPDTDTPDTGTPDTESDVP